MSGAPDHRSSRARRRFVVYTFDSAHDSLTAERLLADSGLSVRAIPKPRSLGGGCGIALRVEPAEAPLAEKLLAGCPTGFSARGEIEDL